MRILSYIFCRTVEVLRKSYSHVQRFTSKSTRAPNPDHPNFDIAQAGKSEGLLIQDQSPNQTGKIKLGKCWLGRYCELTVGDGNEINIGNRVTINPFTAIIGSVRIGSYSAIAPRCFMSSGTHHFDKEPHDLIRNQDKRHASTPCHNQPIDIGEDVWIGVGTFIKAGVTIGRGAVIGAGSVVTRDIDPYTVAVGSPCKPIRQRVNFSPKAEIFACNVTDRPYFYKGFLQHESALATSLTNDALYAEKECTIALCSGTFSKIEIGYLHLAKGQTLALELYLRDKMIKRFELGKSQIIRASLPDYPRAYQRQTFVSIHCRCYLNNSDITDIAMGLTYVRLA